MAYLLLRVFFSYRVVGLEKVPKDGPLIIAGNHASMLDPIVVGAGVKNRRVHYMSKDDLFRNKALAWFLRSICVFPVSRGSGDRGAIRLSLDLLAEGEAVGIFPEGTRTADGTLGAPQPGLAMIAQKSGAPVLTIACVNTFAAFPKGGKFPKRVHVELRIGDLLTVQDLGLAEPRRQHASPTAGEPHGEDRKESRMRLEAAGAKVMASIGRLL